MKRMHISKALVILFLLFTAVVTIFPIFWIFIMGTQSTLQIYQGVSFMPGGHFLENYMAIQDVNFFRSFGNSIMVAMPTVLVSVLTSAMAGYALAKFRFRGANVLMGTILIIMLVPNETSIVAYVIEMRKFGFSHTLLPLIFINLAHAFGVFWMRQYIVGGVPYEIIESCRVDGCSEPRIFFQFVLPIIKPALFTLSVIVFMASWNNYLYPLVLINKQAMYTIPMAIASVGTRDTPMLGAKSLGVLLGILPLLVVFILFSKAITRGLTEGAVKG